MGMEKIKPKLEKYLNIFVAGTWNAPMAQKLLQKQQIRGKEEDFLSHKTHSQSCHEGCAGYCHPRKEGRSPIPSPLPQHKALMW